MGKCCGESAYPWVMLGLSLLWLLGSIFPKFAAKTMWVPWLPLIVLVAALGWLNCSCKK